MVKTLKVLSLLLSYPEKELQHAAPALLAAIDEDGLVTGADRRALAGLIEEIAAGDIYDLQERYVLLFDRTRSLSLHLFEHVHGEGRDRGQAMIDLKSLYEKQGLAISATELPDYLPLFLEFLSTQPLDKACALLGEAGHIVGELGARLRKRKSLYAAVFRVLVTLAATPPIEERLVDEDDVDPMDFDALDAAWEDEPVTFGPEASSGCKDELIARLRAAKRPPPPARPE